MLLRISLILAIIAGLAAGGLGYYEVTTQIPALAKQRDNEQSAKKQAQTELAKTKTDLKKTKSELAQTQQDLSDTKSDLAKSEERADAQAKRADALNDKLTTVTQQRDDAQNDLAAFKASSLTPDQVISLNKRLIQAGKQIAIDSDENLKLFHRTQSLQAKLDAIIGPSKDILLPADLKGKVVVVDPKWDFVVLDIGNSSGAIQGGELLVSRDGKLVAKVIIRSLQKDSCIANVIPGWKLGEPIEGDEVTPAHPAS
jgi:hypothetical protein